MSLVDVDNLTIRYDGNAVVKDVSFAIDTGESVGIVGESGSGKTQTALAMMGLLPGNAEVSGDISFDGQPLLGASADVINQYRACRMAMVFQDPRLALNPYVRIGKQLTRILLAHGLCSARDAQSRVTEMLARVGLPDPERQFRAFPHELSGGMRQRAMIGAALIGEPELLIADEPTTALDVTIQAQILNLIRELQQETRIALLLITHDLGVVAGNCQRVLVLDHGKLVEEGTTRDVFKNPTSEQTRTLLSAAPAITSGVLAPERHTEQDVVMSIDSLAVSFRSRGILPGESINALQPVSFELGNAETVAVVGESGSGKTSLVRAALGLVPADSGRVSFLGEALPATLSRRKNDIRRQLQMVFQDPIASLNPAMTVQDIVVEPLLVHERGMDSKERRTATTEMLSRVGLDTSLGRRYAHELSGGQAQRVAIARALITRPRVLVCDEAVAALDGTVQHEILNLLVDEQRRSGLSMIFITHDLAVVRQIAHRVLVIYMGRLCEVSGNDNLFARPRHPYSKALINAVPVPDPDAPTIDVPLQGETASMLNPPTGCPFHPRCQHAIAVCSEAVPEAEQVDGATVACHRASELDLSY